MTSRPATPPKAPPPAPTSRSVVLEQRIDLEQLRRITIEDGDCHFQKSIAPKVRSRLHY